MNSLAAFVLNLCSLLEAEGQLLQENILRTFSRILFILGGAAFAVTAIAFFIAGIYNLFIYFMPKALALACVGLVSGLVSAILFWSSAQWGKKKKASASETVQE